MVVEEQRCRRTSPWIRALREAWQRRLTDFFLKDGKEKGQNNGQSAGEGGLQVTQLL